MAKVEIHVVGLEVQDVELWRKKLLKDHPELSAATDASKHGNRYRVTLSEETELERKSRK
jgi:hypothetical protein